MAQEHKGLRGGEQEPQSGTQSQEAGETHEACHLANLKCRR